MKRNGRTGIFTNASRTLRKRQVATRSALSAHGVAYTWDIASDVLTWGPNAPEALGLPQEDLPRTGEAFARLLEPGSGLARPEAMVLASEAFDARHGLRFGPSRAVMVQDAGRWQPDSLGRPALVRGLMRVEPQDCLPTAVRARSDLLCRLETGIGETLRLSRSCTLILGAFDDEAVESVADAGRMLLPMLRRPAQFAVLGPRRFALVLAGCPAAEAMSAMRRLARLLDAHPARSSLRLGAASSPDHAIEAIRLLRLAEDALAVGIARGEAGVLYDAAYAVPKPARDRAGFDWLAALNGRRVSLACRPLADARTRAPALVQARAALPGADGRMIPLTPTAPDPDLALLLDGRLLELAADRLVRHPHERLLLPVSPETLRNPEWLAMLAAHLGARPRIESRLVIELPESIARDTAARGRLDAMKALGVGIALSGFGTGHASFARLQSLPVDLLKIDGVFIQPLKRSTDDRLYVQTLIGMAHRLGIAVAAEWVDDEDSARMLVSWGVDYLEEAPFGEIEPASPARSEARRKRA